MNMERSKGWRGYVNVKVRQSDVTDRRKLLQRNVGVVRQGGQHDVPQVRVR